MEVTSETAASAPNGWHPEELVASGHQHKPKLVPSMHRLTKKADEYSEDGDTGDDESAASRVSDLSATYAHSPTRKHRSKSKERSKKELDHTKKKKKRPLLKSAEALGRKSPIRKKHSSSESEEEHQSHKHKKKDRNTKVKSPKQASSSEDEREHKHRRTVKSKHDAKQSKKSKKTTKAPKKTDELRHDSDEGSSEPEQSLESSTESEEPRRSPSRNSRTPDRKARKTRRDKLTASRGGRFFDESSDEEEVRRSRKSSRSSRASSRGESQEPAKGDAIRRRSPLSISTSGDASPHDGILSPKEEEIGRMHKEIETLKNLTKILEEKLEILEHDDGGAIVSSARTSTRRFETSGNITTHSARDMSNSADGLDTRKKIKLRTTQSTPNGMGLNTPHEHVTATEVSRSTTDLSKHRRNQLSKKEREEVAKKQHSESETSDSDSAESSSGAEKEGNEQRKLRKSISLTELRNMPNSNTEVGQIKREHDLEKKVTQKRAKRERARSKREAKRHMDVSPDPHGGLRARTCAAMNIAPFGNTPATKSLECFSCLMKTDIPADGERKLWKRRVLGLGKNGMHLIKPYTEKIERVWPWSTIQQWVINDEQNLIKFMIEDAARSDDDSESSDSDGNDRYHSHKDRLGHHEREEETDGQLTIYTFRVEDANKVNDSLWKVVKRVQKKRRTIGDKSSANSSARVSDDESTSSEEEHHHTMKESMQSFFKALTHSLGHKSEHHHKSDKTDPNHKDRKSLNASRG